MLDEFQLLEIMRSGPRGCGCFLAVLAIVIIALATLLT